MSRGNWLNPLSQLIMSMSFQTSNSGAFRSLHCLIYKVLAPFRVRCGTFTILPQAFRFVKYFFRLFSKSFFRTRLAGACRSEAWLSYHIFLALSSTFFDSFQNLFLTQPLSRLSLESLITLPQLPAFVKPFFRFPQNFFPKPWNARASRRQLA